MLGSRKLAALTAVALPLLLAGCASSSSGTTGEEDSSNAGRDWILVDEGKATPSPVTTYGKASPTPSTGLPTATSSTSPTATPSPTCTPLQRVKAIDGLGVEPGSTSAVVTWYNPGGSDIIDYRITAASQRLVTGTQKELGWTKSAPAGCGYVTATVTGLEPATPYVFTVDVVRTRDGLGLEGVNTRTVARSSVVSTT